VGVFVKARVAFHTDPPCLNFKPRFAFPCCSGDLPEEYRFWTLTGAPLEDGLFDVAFFVEESPGPNDYLKPGVKLDLILNPRTMKVGATIEIL
jgi:hypothetical protein